MIQLTTTTCPVKAFIPPFTEFKTDEKTEFIRYNFHKCHDGLIGSRNLQKLNLSFDMETNPLTNRETSISCYFEDVFSNYRFDLNPLNIITKNFQ